MAPSRPQPICHKNTALCLYLVHGIKGRFWAFTGQTSPVQLLSSLRDSLPNAIGAWRPRRALLGSAIITATALASPGAIAGPVVQPGGSLLFLYSINGGADPTGANPPPPGTTPWLTALIQQAGPDAVDIVLTPSLGAAAYAISWGFNMNPEEINFPASAFTYSCSSTGKDVCDKKEATSYIWDPNMINMRNN